MLENPRSTSKIEGNSPGGGELDQLNSRIEKIKISRQKLYELVWSKPTTILADSL